MIRKMSAVLMSHCCIRKSIFELLDSEAFPLIFVDDDGGPDYSRDVLLVKREVERSVDLFYCEPLAFSQKGNFRNAAETHQSCKFST